MFMPSPVFCVPKVVFPEDPKPDDPNRLPVLVLPNSEGGLLVLFPNRELPPPKIIFIYYYIYLKSLLWSKKCVFYLYFSLI